MSSSIVDAHTHVFPPEVVARRDHYLARDPWFRHLYENPAIALASPTELLASMDAAGVARSIMCGFPWADPELCRAHTEWMASVSAEAGGRLPFLGIVVPQAPRAAYETEHAFALGAVGLGELNADAQGFDLLAPASLTEVMAVCAAQGKPIMLHASEPVGHSYLGKGSATPERLVAFLSAYPAQPVVLAHWGGGLPFYELMPEVRAVTHFVSYDSAATTYLYNSAVFPAVVSLVGPERVLFASDYPVLRQDRLLRRVQRILPAEPTLSSVLGANAARVYGLRSVAE